MPDDQSWNSMQAQLGLVGGSGSFNPLGIATPAPPQPPLVRHPGDISQDVVRQTQTQMATTLQTTSAMRLGGMGGMAFGGGSGMGMGAIGAFAQQYQQNMAGINAQHASPFSAQMMGMMGGMGGGFQPGMLPHPSMMTTPGMGIYRPFPQQQGATVSPFPQMPLLQTPITPMPPPPMFQTPMELSNNMAIQAGQRRTGALFATPGVMARAGTDIGMGAMGAGLGASLGARFGPRGALIGGGLGMAAGAFGSESMGFGSTAQHMADRLNPFRTMAIRGQQMMGASQGWINGGPDLNPMTGRGLSSSGSTHLGRMLEDTAFSSGFRRQTGGAFSAQDLTKITNVAGQQGMLNDAQSVEQIHARVKGIAKSLVGFMKIANEPNVVEALKSMGKMRAMGLSVAETMDAAVDARMFSKMSGMSQSGLMAAGGMPGAMLFQQQGLSAGLGMRVGMGAMGMAGAAVAGGAFTPQRLAMLGGMQGVAQHEMESSAAFLKMPMMAAAMSQMGRGGEFNVRGGALAALRSGKVNIGDMASMGANNLLSAVSKQGFGALGMMHLQESELQDQAGKLMGPQGLQVAKMNQVMQTMGMMGLDKNRGGFATAALGQGFTKDQTKAMMSMAGSPGYWRNLQAQNQAQLMEVRGLAFEEQERTRPGAWSNMTRMGSGNVSRVLGDAYSGLRNVGEGISDFFATDEQGRQARGRGQTVLRKDRSLLATSEEELHEIYSMTPERVKASDRRRREAREESGIATSRQRRGILGSTEDYETLAGGSYDARLEDARREGGWSAAFGAGGVMAEGALTALGSLPYGLLGAAEELTGINTGIRVRDIAEEKRIARAENERGNQAWIESMHYSDRGAYLDKTKELGEKTGLGQEKVARISARINMALSTKARKERNWFMTNKQMGGEAYEAVEAALTAEGVNLKDLPEGERKTLLALGGVGVAEYSLNLEATAPRAGGGEQIKTQKDRVDRHKRELEDVTGEMFGEDTKGRDYFKGTQKRRNTLRDKLFGKGRTGNGAMLLALKVRGETDPKAREAFTEAYGKADKRDLREMDMLMKEGVHEEFKADIARLGKTYTAHGTYDQQKKLTQEWKDDTLGGKRASIMAEGLSRAFGAETAAGQSVGELLQGDLESIQNPQMRALAAKYQMTDDPRKRAKMEQEAEDIGMRLATNTETSLFGGKMSVAEKAVQMVGGAFAESEQNVSKAFPGAVDRFKEASETLMDAAEALLKGKGLSPDVGGN